MKKSRPNAIDRFIEMLDAGLAELPPRQQCALLLRGRLLLRERHLRAVAADMAEFTDKYLAKLPPAERERRLRALERVVARVTGKSRKREGRRR